MLALFIAFLVLTTVQANIHPSRLRPKRLGHTSHSSGLVSPRDITQIGSNNELSNLLGALSGIADLGSHPVPSPTPAGSSSPTLLHASSIVSKVSPSSNLGTHTDGTGTSTLHRVASPSPSPASTPDVSQTLSDVVSSTQSPPGVTGGGGILPSIVGGLPLLPSILPPLATSPDHGSSSLSSDGGLPHSSQTTPSTTTSDGGLLGISPINIPPILPSLSPSLISSAPPQATPSTPSPASSDDGLLPPISLPPILPPPSTPSQANPSNPSPTSSDGGLLPSISLPPLLPSPSSPPTPSGSLPPSTSSDGGLLPIPTISIISILPLPTPSPNPPAPSPTTPSNPPPSSSDGGLIPPISISLPPILPSPSPSPTPSDRPPHDTPPGHSSSSDDGLLPPISISLPPIGISSEPSPSPSVPFQGTPIGFPSPSPSSNGTGTSTPVLSVPNSSVFPSGTLSPPTSLITVSSSTSTVPGDPLLSFVTETTLPVSPTSSAIANPLGDPDAALTTTPVLVPTGSGSPTSAPIPSDLPTRIFAPDSVNPETDTAKLKDKTLISILFQLSLNWKTVNVDSQVMGNVFLGMPRLLSAALNISESDVSTYVLQVEVPQNWNGDPTTLGTVYLAYLPTSKVDELAAMMRAPMSQFYRQSGVLGQLANLVVPSFSLVSVTPGASDTAKSGTPSSTLSTANKQRTDAIIGVCAVLGSFAALVAIWWLMRYVQRKQEARHRRLSNLSDPNLSNGVYGTQYDDRRTSFFYAEDELRGGYSEPASALLRTGNPPPVDSTSQQHMRLATQHANISAPVLHQNSLNW